MNSPTVRSIILAFKMLIEMHVSLVEHSIHAAHERIIAEIIDLSLF